MLSRLIKGRYQAMVLLVVFFWFTLVTGENLPGICSTLDKDSLLLGNKCIKFFNWSLTWTEAQKFCQVNLYDAMLVEPTTDEDMLTVINLVKSAGSSNAWIGASDIATKGHFVWSSDQSAITTTLWDIGQPDHAFPGDDCVEVTTMNLAARNCSLRKPFVCQIEIKVPDPCRTSSTDTIFINGKCMKLFRNIKLSWHRAQLFCEQNFHNGTLAETVTSLEQRIVMALVKQLGETNVWLGGNDLMQENNFVWSSDGSAMSPSLTWCENGPNNLGGNENCVEIWAYGPTYCFNDHWCDLANSFVCQTAAQPFTNDTCYPWREAVNVDGKCIKMFHSPKDWSSAQTFCSSLDSGAALFEIFTEDDRETASSYGMKRAIGQFWIGGEDKFKNGTYFWSTSPNVSIAPNQWASSGPQQGQHCVGLLTSQLFDFTSCEADLFYICENVRNSLTSVVSATGKVLQASESSSTSFNVSQKLCEKYDGALAELYNVLDLESVARLLIDKRMYYVGATDYSSSGTFVWSKQRSVIRDNWWSVGQPKLSEGCVSMNSNSKTFDATNCSSNLPFVCKIELTNPCDVYFPGGIYGYGQCFKYYDLLVTWETAQNFCLNINSYLAEPETQKMRSVLRQYIWSNQFTVWLGASNSASDRQFRYVVSNNTVYTDNLQAANFLPYTQYIMWSYWWDPTPSNESSGFVCQTAAVAHDPRLYVAVVPRLSKTSLIQGLLQVTSSYSEVIYLRFKVSYNSGSETITVLPLAPRTAANFYLHQNISLDSTGVYTRYVELNSSQPVTVVLYVMGDSLTWASSTLLYPVHMYTAGVTSYLLPSNLLFKKVTDITLTVTSMYENFNDINLMFNNQNAKQIVYLGETQFTFSIVDNISTNLDSLYSSLNVHLKRNLDGSYLYSSLPVMVHLSTTDNTLGSTLDEVLPLQLLGKEYIIFPTYFSNQLNVYWRFKLMAVYAWTQITFMSSETKILLESAGDIYYLSRASAGFLYISGNESFYAYHTFSGSNQDLCVMSLLPPNSWRYEYEFASVSDSFKVTIYIVGDVSMPLTIETSDDSVQWTCVKIEGTNYSGCHTTLASSVTYLHLQLTNKRRTFGAYILAIGTKSTYCHPMGIADTFKTAYSKPFQHKPYLELLQEKQNSLCPAEMPTFETDVTSDVTASFTSDATSDVTSDVTSQVTTAMTTPGKPDSTSDARDTTEAVTTASRTSTAPHDTSTSRGESGTTSTQTTMTSTPNGKELAAALVEQLTVNHRNLSAYRRTLSSAQDVRPSSTVFGWVGLIVVSIVLALLVLSDLMYVYKFLQSMLHHKAV